MLSDPNQIKRFYTSHHDHISDKRYNSPYWIRRYAHRQIHAQFLPHLKPGQRVLDAGCGEGILSCLVAKQGLEVVGVDISTPNIKNAKRLAQSWGIKATFIQGDAEELPFHDRSFDVVLSSHVLEHLPDLDKGLSELYRVTRNQALIAMPTCLNPACWVLLGRDNFWKLGRRSAVALSIGLFKTISSFVRGEEGPDEGYTRQRNVSHIWRFPWVMRQRIRNIGFLIEYFEAGPLIFPYLGEYFQKVREFQRFMDLFRGRPLIRNFGYGSLAVCRRK
jgi:SAM-dependent methyltransferase